MRQLLLDRRPSCFDEAKESGLTNYCATAKSAAIMRKQITLLAASMVAFAGLAACGESEPEVVGEMYDPADQEELAAEEADMEVPPMVRASRSYRCADNSVVYVTFYTNDTQVGVASERSAPPTILPNEAMAAADDGAEADIAEEAAAEGPARFSGDGGTLVGTGDSITYNGQSCNA